MPHTENFSQRPVLKVNLNSHRFSTVKFNNFVYVLKLFAHTPAKDVEEIMSQFIDVIF
jgi:hypothetical protein